VRLLGRDATHERRLADALTGALDREDREQHLCRSSGSAAVRHHRREAYLRPGGGVVARLDAGPRRGSPSSGDGVERRTLSLAQPPRDGTGPAGTAGGVEGARLGGAAAGERRLLTLDMGGTSADASVVLEDRPLVQMAGSVGGVPIALPHVLIETVGAGGGSVAWVDAGGALRVGPRSAGAVPGPACYGRGGTDATVTDAVLVLGWLDPGQPLASDLRLDPAAARPRWPGWRAGGPRHHALRRGDRRGRGGHHGPGAPAGECRTRARSADDDARPVRRPPLFTCRLAPPWG
jgi:hypothetical protein